MITNQEAKIVRYKWITTGYYLTSILTGVRPSYSSSSNIVAVLNEIHTLDYEILQS